MADIDAATALVEYYNTMPVQIRWIPYDMYLYEPSSTCTVCAQVVSQKKLFHQFFYSDFHTTTVCVHVKPFPEYSCTCKICIHVHEYTYIALYIM